ncbi:MAG: DUF4192 domain-containing protein [Jiangellaceae bacterium]
MTPARPPVIIKFTCPTEIVGAMPTFVGFHPAESLVLMCLRGPRKRNGMTMRADLPDALHHRVMAADLASRAAADKAGTAILVCYTCAPDVDGRLPRQDLIDEQVEQLRRRTIGVTEALLVRDGRWYSYSCHKDCCPRIGTLIPERPSGTLAQLAAESALNGRVILGSREELEASVRGPVAFRLVAMEQVFDLVDATLAAEMAAEGLDRVATRTVALAREAFGRFVDGNRDLDDAGAARIVLGLHDKLPRDELTTWPIDGHGGELIAFFADLAQRTPDYAAAPICTVLAAAAYQEGHGALTGIALERALRADPFYEMARLYTTGLADQVPPERIRKLSRDVRKDLRRRGRRAS